MQPGWTQTFPMSGPTCPNGTIGYAVDVDLGVSVSGRDFGNVQQAQAGSSSRSRPTPTAASRRLNSIPATAPTSTWPTMARTTAACLPPAATRSRNWPRRAGTSRSIQIVSGDTDNGSTVGGDGTRTYTTATIDLDAGEVITVRFTNTQRGRIIVEKQTNPDGSIETFEFDPSYGANFNLADNGQNNSGLLAPGSYTVQELAEAGWDLTNIQIVSGDTDNGSTIGGDGTRHATATIDLDAGEVITVRFTNTQRGRIIVEKQTNPDGSIETFEFDPSYGANFHLADNGQNNSGLLAPGSYTVQELAETGWDLTNIQIVSGDTDSGSTIGGDGTRLRRRRHHRHDRPRRG